MRSGERAAAWAAAWTWSRPRLSVLALAGLSGAMIAGAWGCREAERARPGSVVLSPDGGDASGEGGRGVEAGSPPDTRRIIEALTPVRMRVHPLTRLEPDEAGRLRLMCHLELADRWGHSGKWLGLARVELYRPTREDDRASETQDLVWTVNLAEPEANAASYDWITRTYVLPLGGLPEWVDAVYRTGGAGSWVTVRAYFTTVDAGGRPKILQASYRVKGG